MKHLKTFENFGSQEYYLYKGGNSERSVSREEFLRSPDAGASYVKKTKKKKKTKKISGKKV